jgi:hypothetical protein
VKAIWVILIAIVLAIAIVFVYLRGESTRKSLAEFNTWNQGPRQEWADTLTKEFNELRTFVCDQHPDKCTFGDKYSDPPDPPPELP